MFFKYKALVDNKLYRKLKRLRSDRRGEYDATSLKKICEANGITDERIAPCESEKNVTLEKENMTLKNILNDMLISVIA